MMEIKLGWSHVMNWRQKAAARAAEKLLADTLRKEEIEHLKQSRTIEEIIKFEVDQRVKQRMGKEKSGRRNNDDRNPPPSRSSNRGTRRTRGTRVPTRGTRTPTRKTGD